MDFRKTMMDVSSEVLKIPATKRKHTQAIIKPIWQNMP
jgi:hypothetical protein